jgi:hypothetical protein
MHPCTHSELTGTSSSCFAAREAALSSPLRADTELPLPPQAAPALSRAPHRLACDAPGPSQVLFGNDFDGVNFSHARAQEQPAPSMPLLPPMPPLPPSQPPPVGFPSLPLLPVPVHLPVPAMMMPDNLHDAALT